MLTIYKIALILIASCFGSFINVLIYRIPLGLSAFKPGSYCPNCRQAIKWQEKIPIVSYLLLKAKCCNCSAKIPLKYFLVELGFVILSLPFINKLVDDANVVYMANPIVSDIAFAQVILFVEFLFKIFLLSIIVALAYIDVDKHILPHSLTYSAILVSVLYFSVFGVPYSAISPELQNLLPGFAYSFFAVIKQLGIAFFLLDFFVHFANKIFFGKNASAIKSPALTLGFEFLEKKISFVYLIVFSFLLVSLFNYQYEFFKITFELIFFLLGCLYFFLEIIFAYFFAAKEEIDDSLGEEKAELNKSILGGGDVALVALFATVMGYQKSFLVFLLAFYILFFYLIIKLIFDYLGSSDKKLDLASYLKLQIPMGAALAVSFIAVMIFS